VAPAPTEIVPDTGAKSSNGPPAFVLPGGRPARTTSKRDIAVAVLFQSEPAADRVCPGATVVALRVHCCVR
jgi:hypothetical protein